MDKKPIYKEEELVGKTIAKVVLCYDGAFLMSFTDGTFTALLAEYGPCGDEAELDFDRHPEEENLLAIGMLSTEEYKAIVEARNAEREQQEREQYERLKKQFDPTC